MSIALLVADGPNDDVFVVDTSCDGLRGMTRLEGELFDSTETIQHVSTIVLCCL